jgi:50S ribosomal subunit-associated GTPase HflX
LIVLDVGLKTSFEGIDKWLDFVRESRGHDALVFLVGNKADLVEREVSKKELDEYAEKNRYSYIEVSAKNGSNIASLFRKISERLIESKTGDKVTSQTAASDKDKKKESKSEPATIELKKTNEVKKAECKC